MLARGLTKWMGRHSGAFMLNKWLSFDHLAMLPVDAIALMISHASPNFRSINIAMTRSYDDHANPGSVVRVLIKGRVELEIACTTSASRRSRKLRLTNAPTRLLRPA